VEELRPKYAQLKFKLPHYIEDQGFRYFDGIAYLQAYSQIYSDELRLVVDGSGRIKYKVWDVQTYNNAMFTFNVHLRPGVYATRVKNQHVGHCHDCVMFVQLLQDYKKYGTVSYFKKMSTTKLLDFVVENIPRSMEKLASESVEYVE